MFKPLWGLGDLVRGTANDPVLSEVLKAAHRAQSWAALICAVWLSQALVFQGLNFLACRMGSPEMRKVEALGHTVKSMVSWPRSQERTASPITSMVLGELP